MGELGGAAGGHQVLDEEAAAVDAPLDEVADLAVGAVGGLPRGGGRIDISWGGRTRIDGQGLDSSATAAGFGNLAGKLRAEELAEVDQILDEIEGLSPEELERLLAEEMGEEAHGA